MDTSTVVLIAKNQEKKIPELRVSVNYLAKTYVSNVLSDLNISNASPCYQSAYTREFQKIKDNLPFLYRWATCKQFYTLLLKQKGSTPIYSITLSFREYLTLLEKEPHA